MTINRYHQYENNSDIGMGGIPPSPYGIEDVTKSITIQNDPHYHHHHSNNNLNNSLNNSNNTSNTITTRGSKRKNIDISVPSISSHLLEAAELNSPIKKQNLQSNNLIEVQRPKFPQLLPKLKIPTTYEKNSPLISANISSSSTSSSSTRLNAISADFTSPAIISQPQESNMSPDNNLMMIGQRNSCNCKKSRCLKL